MFDSFEVDGPEASFTDQYYFFDASDDLARLYGRQARLPAATLLRQIEDDCSEEVVCEDETIVRALAVVTFSLLSRFDERAFSLSLKAYFVSSVNETLMAGGEAPDSLLTRYQKELNFRIGAYVAHLYDRPMNTEDESLAILADEELLACMEMAAVHFDEQ